MNDTEHTTQAARGRWLVPLVLAILACGVFGSTLSRSAFPGLPAKNLAWHLGLDSAPTLLDPAWGWLVRVSAALPGAAPAFWMALWSAICGAACVALLGALCSAVRGSTGKR